MSPPADAARRRHYAGLYDPEPLADDARPVLVVHGICQAEALRVVIEATTDEVRAVRVPPVHELTADDVPPLLRLLARADVLVAQPVRDDFHGLPLGTDQVAARAPRAQLVRIPVVRYTGLHPWTVLVRTPWMGDPPVVPYHDLRTILTVARGAVRPVGHRRPDGYRAVARLSLDGLRGRETAHGTLRASDLVEDAGARATLTPNHPGNAVLVPLAGRVTEACGIASPPRDPGRTLLPSVRAPVLPEVLDALGLGDGPTRETWALDDRRLGDDEIVAAQLGWYAGRGPVVDAAIARNAREIEALGL
ncbi:WcbI family polysaccharide biosynthesis putative acetyltransferase [Patulibacter minatonensis]|uniref:WcbI family polysaccharide biosynthesis putative acetyltransferase n=1 Tax=Patulibacter minatonensis TaxID=298163 RepID=UPI0006870AD3|nr:WcbI family polysaccharide biosynthesis putative acetyltransferase [Patulibacter minatonensis]